MLKHTVRDDTSDKSECPRRSSDPTWQLGPTVGEVDCDYTSSPGHFWCDFGAANIFCSTASEKENCEEESMISKVLPLIALLSVTSAQYQPTWESLDSRPLPSWYDEAKFGIFMHWGVYSVPSFGSEWFWYRWKTGEPAFVEFMKKNYPPNFQYADFAPMFKAEFFDPNVWAELLSMSGARYVVLTSKHHEGWTNWRSNVSWNWNSVDNGPHRDLVDELAQAVRQNTNLVFGLYHSLFEWFNPLYLKDQANKYQTQDYVKEVLLPELYDLINTYKPEYLWSDGDAGPDTYWTSREFLAWLYNESPVKDTVVTNDRWCNNGCMCHHGGVFTCSDHYNPGKLQKHKWENAMTVDKLSWGYRRNADIMDYLTIEELLYQLVSTVRLDNITFSSNSFLMDTSIRRTSAVVPFLDVFQSFYCN
ncbi:hypothetical protein ACROYT_G006305 [Oculina patagonica]